MREWLSATWGPNWRSLRFFNLYRLVVAVVLLVSFLLPMGWNTQHPLLERGFLQYLAAGYMCLVAVGWVISERWQQRFNLQLSLQMLLDVLVVAVLMRFLGGVAGGIGLLLMISLAAASLAGRGRMVPFYAALATLGVLLQQLWGVVQGEFESGTIVQAGLLCCAYFATAILARLFGQRAMMQEDLARRRGEALDNQIRIGQRIMERMQDGVLVLDPAGTILRYNPSAAGMLDLQAGKTINLAERSLPLLAAYFRWRRGEQDEPIEVDGVADYRLRARFAATDSGDGEALAFIEDIGRIRSQAKQLKLASLGRLTASIAHEVRNPLAAISHASDLLHEERRGEMQERLLRILHDNVYRLDRIVQDILQLGRSDLGQPERLDLQEFLRGFVDEVNAVEQIEPGVLALELERPVHLYFDRSQLLQVLWNLAGNALRHAGREQGSVRLHVAASGNGRVELHVIDDGPGIPPEHREQIFEPFFTTRHQGTGLGLFIARELCEANGASLQLLPDGGGHFVIIGGEDCQSIAANAATAG